MKFTQQCSRKDKLLSDIILNYTFWMKQEELEIGYTDDLEVYNFSASDITMNEKAEYKGIPTDECLYEILKESAKNLSTCHISQTCHEIMQEDTIDTGYLLTHRLFYLQVTTKTKCISNKKSIKKQTHFCCSLMMKEAKTKEHLDLPQQDIFLEQVVLCGLEGYIEFSTRILRKSDKENIIPEDITFSFCSFIKNAANISFGCTGNTNAAQISPITTNLRYLLICILFVTERCGLFWQGYKFGETRTKQVVVKF